MNSSSDQKLLHVEQALRASEARYRALVYATTDALYRLSADGKRVIEVSGTDLLKHAADREQTIDWLLGNVHPDERRTVRRAWSAAIGSHSCFELEHRVRKADGSWVWVVSRAAPVYNDQGEVSEWIGSVSKITQRHEAEQALRESELRFRTMADGLPLIIWVHDSQGKQEFVNKTFCEYFNVDPEQMQAESWQMLMHPDDAPAYTEHFNACVRDRRAFHAQVRVKRGDGQWRWLESWGRPRFAADGAFLGFVGTSADVTERKEVEQELHQSRQRFVMMADAAPAMLWLSDAEHQCTFLSQGWSRFTGIDPAQGLGLGWTEPVHPDDRERVLETFFAAANRHEPFKLDYRLRTREGHYRWVMDAARPLFDAGGQFEGYVGSVFDIHDRKIAGQAVRESEQRFRRLADAMPQLAWEADADGTVRYYNSRISQYAGFEQQPDGRWRWEPAIHSEDQQRTVEAWRAAVNNRSTYVCEHRVRMADGSFRWHLSRAEPVHLGDDQYRWFGTGTDIHDLKLAEQALAMELADHKRLQEVSTQLIQEGDYDALLNEIMNAAIEVMHADKASVQLLDEETGNLRIRTWRGFSQHCVDHFDREGARNASCGAALRSGERVIVRDVTLSNLYDDAGRQIMLDEGARAVQSTPLVSRAGRVLGVISTHWSEPHEPQLRELRLMDVLARQAADLIERHHAEHELREARSDLERRVTKRTAALQQQAARLRELANQLAAAEHRERKRLAALLHDGLQQYLVAADLQIGRAARRLDEGKAKSAILAAAEMIAEASKASRDLTRQLRPPVLYEDGLAPAIRWLASEMDKLHGLRVGVEAPPQPLPLNDDTKAMLFESVRELLLNVVKHAGADEAHVNISREEPEGAVHITVRDSGAGFDAAGMHEREQGMGLLSVRERLAALGGDMTIDSVLNNGTIVRIMLPGNALAPDVTDHDTPDRPRRAARSAATAPPPPAAAPLFTGSRTRVLVVDDHPIVRQGIANILSGDSRIAVIAEAGDGLAAVQVIERTPPDVVLMDVNMPRMNGVEATRIIRQRWPEIRVVATSVQDDEASARMMLNAGATAFVPKSADPDQMIEAILVAAPRI